jgi:hypothetical protein
MNRINHTAVVERKGRDPAAFKEHGTFLLPTLNITAAFRAHLELAFSILDWNCTASIETGTLAKQSQNVYINDQPVPLLALRRPVSYRPPPHGHPSPDLHAHAAEHAKGLPIYRQGGS